MLIRKLIEWDKGRKFGCEFKDFLIMLILVFIVNTLPILFSWGLDARMLLAFISVIVHTLVVNRRSPE